MVWDLLLQIQGGGQLRHGMSSPSANTKGAAKTWYELFFYKYKGDSLDMVWVLNLQIQGGGQLRHGMGSSSTNTRGGTAKTWYEFSFCEYKWGS